MQGATPPLPFLCIPSDGVRELRAQEHPMERNVHDILNLYNPHDPLDHAWTISSPWYFDQAVAQLEHDNVFATTWLVVGRVDQVQKKGEFFTADIGGEPIVVARGEDNQL